MRGATTYRTLLIWPYAVAPVLAGALWMFMFDPTLGIFPYLLDMVGVGLEPLPERQAGHDAGNLCRRLEADRL